MSNSIRSNLTKADIISEIKLSIGADIGKEYTFLLVEGIDDIKFWRGMVTEKVMIYESFSGKNGIKEIISEHFNADSQVIGVRDKDYEAAMIHDRIYYYDYCCMEMMFIKSNEASMSIYSEYYEGERPMDDLRNRILTQLKCLSIIRQLNERNHWGIKIDGVSLNNAFESTTEDLILDRIFVKINEMNTDVFNVSPEKKQSIDSILNGLITYEELLNITQGHDYLKLFAAYCLKQRGRAVNDINLSASLRCAYRKSDFMETALYSDLVQHESRYNLRVVS